MIAHRAALAALAIAGLAACNEAPKETAFDPTDTASLCQEVKSLSLTAQRDSFSFSFAQADQKFARLIALYDSADVASRCPDSPSRAFLLASQGLALSNQEQFRLAEAAFESAQDALDAQTNPRSDEVLLLKNFRVQDALNRGQDVEESEAFGELSTLLQTDSATDLGTIAFDDLFAPDQASVRKRVGIASSEYVRSISLASSKDKSIPREQRLSEAEAAIDKAINLIGTVPSASAAYLPRFLIQKAVVELERGNPSSARRNAARAAESLNELLPGTPLGARALLVQAKAEAEDGDATAALATYGRAFSVYEENPVPIRSETVWSFFQLALDVRSRDPSRAQELNAQMFRAAQIVRSSVAAKTISGAAALFSEGDSEAARAVRSWQSANDTYGLLKAAQVQAKFDTLAAPDAQASLAQQVADAERALDAALEARDRLAPSYRATLDAPTSLADVQAVLKPNEALVQVLVIQPRNIIFLVEKDSVEVSNVKIPAEAVPQTIAAMRGYVEVNESNEFRNFDAEVGHLAYQVLLGEIGPQLSEFDSLIFAVSGPMASLPMEMLVVEEPDGAQSAAWRNGDYRNIAWLGAQSDISYVPSPRNLVDIRGRAGQSAATNPVITFGDFTPGASVSSFLDLYGLDDNCRAIAEAVANLEPLPETAIEARMIAEALGAPESVRLGNEFTKAAFEQDKDFLADYRIVHFATHGLLWPTPDCISEPALSVSVTANSTDPLLTALDIRGLKMDAQLVVLSACETAGPAVRDDIGAGGDSLSGLARAFFAAGARAVMASHWAVFSEQTQELTTAMYREIGQGNRTFSSALRAAQAQLRSDPKTSHPIYWAAFVMIGDGGLTLN
jgi:CHAT domain-containing protein